MGAVLAAMPEEPSIDLEVTVKRMMRERSGGE
jgi:hypothetical protein